uniref:NADH-ubiquinone oxidoreductase chain 1 n=1 Tax=Psychomyia pusilla TaxID=177921 RepID=A0A7G7CCT4_9NEOP|nr:NADH dehydrogenase subunit 1 [Psychomyia pusilla]
MLIVLMYFILLLMVLLSVAFFTLLERKVLGYIQLRKGPNKLGLMGLFQPFSDAIKLFSKEILFLIKINYLFYLFSPFFSFLNALLIWLVIPYMEGGIFFDLGFLFLLCSLGMNVFMIMISGWSSNSNYALLGSFRAIIQVISYEVSLIMIMLNSLLFLMTFNLIMFSLFQLNCWFLFFLLPASLMFLVSILAETNRTPFDFAEGESELVSGFNIEYGGYLFALIFLAEYSMIMFMSFLFVLMFMGSDLFNLIFYLKVLFFMFFFIWMRGTMPRYRYDKLMYLNWKIYLPISMLFLVLMFSIKIFMNWNF